MQKITLLRELQLDYKKRKNKIIMSNIMNTFTLEDLQDLAKAIDKLQWIDGERHLLLSVKLYQVLYKTIMPLCNFDNKICGFEISQWNNLTDGLVIGIKDNKLQFKKICHQCVLDHKEEKLK